jgi:hypothetical protein
VRARQGTGGMDFFTAKNAEILQETEATEIFCRTGRNKSTNNKSPFAGRLARKIIDELPT